MAPGFEDRMQVVIAVAAVEVLVLLTFWLVFELAVRRRRATDQLIVAKFVLAGMVVFHFAASGLGLSLIMFAISFFQSPPRSVEARYVSLFPFVILGWIGILWGIGRFLVLKAPPTESEYAAAEADASRAIDPKTGWPKVPSYLYRRVASELAVLTVLWSAVVLFLTGQGVVVLLATLVPESVPPSIAAKALRGIEDARVGGLLLLGMGIGGGVGGVVLFRSGWRRWSKMRPLAINERGIYAFKRGKPWRFLD